MDRLTIRGRIRTYLRDTDSSNYLWSDDTLNKWIDDVEGDIARVTRILKSRVSSTAIAVVTGDLAFFDAPAYTIEIKEIQYDGVYLPQITPEEAYVFSASGDWEDEPGALPMAVLWGDYGVRRFRVFPKPTTALDLAKFGVHIVHVPTAGITADTGTGSSPQIPEAYHVAIVYGVVAHAYLEDFDLLHPEKAKAFMSLYERVISGVGGSAGQEIAKPVESGDGR